MSALTFAVALGIVCAFNDRPPDDEMSIAGRELTFAATVRNTKSLDTSQRITADIVKTGTSGDSLTEHTPIPVSIIVTGNEPDIIPGDAICFRATFQPVSPITDLPDEIDPAYYLLKEHVNLQAFVPASSIVLSDTLNNSATNEWLRSSHKIRQSVIVAINNSSLSPFSKDILVATIAGDPEYITPYTRQQFAGSGLSHILAISGLHVGLIALIATMVLWPIYAWGYGKLRASLVIILLWVFAFTTGLSPSVVRATIMATIFITGRMLQQRTSSLNTLCLSALVILVFAPGSLFKAGFQLSFAAVISIIVFADRLNPVSPRRRLPYMLVSYLTVSLSAVLGTGLISTFYFHTLPIYFMLGNLVASVILPFLIGGGVFIVILTFMSLPTGWLCAPVNWSASFLELASDGIASLPGASVTNIYLPSWTIIPFILLLFWLKSSLDSQRPQKILISAIGLTVYITALSLAPETDIESRLYITRDKQHTHLIYPSHDHILNIIPTNPLEPENVRDRTMFRYSDYMGKRGIDSVNIDTADSHSDKLLIYNGKSIGLMSGKTIKLHPQKLDYAIICRGFRENITDQIDLYRPDTIILSYDLNPRRAQRYVNECRDLKVPYIWLRESQWSISGSTHQTR